MTPQALSPDRKHNSQAAGFGLVWIILAAAIIVASLLGWQVYRTRQLQEDVSEINVPKAQAINSADDFDQVDQALDDINLDASLQEIEQLEADLQS
ncbi:hypothetical protein HY441_00235 [Candidatus Microgenomates bacterium]|nr:hypothetical protein [Candidatus Microgenomates bacterium]